MIEFKTMNGEQNLTLTLGVFLLYIVGIFLLAVLAYKKTHDRADFLLANRELKALPAALSAGASDMSGWLLLGLPGLAYVAHMEATWLAIGLAIGSLINWKFIAGPLQLFSAERYPALTLPEYFRIRYSDCGKLLSIFSAILILVFYIFYVSAGFVAAAKLFVAAFPLGYSSALLIGVAVVVTYTLIGGFRAVVSTDCIQALMMFTGLLLVFGILAMSPESTPKPNPSANHSVGGGIGPLAIISALAWGLGYPGQPHILARFMAIKSADSVPNGTKIATSWTIICLICAVGIGAFASNHEVLSEVGGDPEQIFITAVQLFFHPLVAGALSAAVLAAIMSTADSQLLIAATALFHDLAGVKTEELNNFSWLLGIRLTIIAVAGVAFLLALDPQNSVLTLVSYAWSGFGATLGPAVILSLFAPKVSGIAVFLGMLSGAVVVVSLELSIIHLPDLYSLIPGFACNLFAAIVSSKYLKPI